MTETIKTPQTIQTDPSATLAEAQPAAGELIDSREALSGALGATAVEQAFNFDSKSKKEHRKFEKTGLAENEETADLFSQYRTDKVARFLEKGRDPSDLSIRSLVEAQEASPYQDAHSTVEMYSQLAQKGDAKSFGKWVNVVVGDMNSSEKPSSESDPFPDLDRSASSELHEIFRGQLQGLSLAQERNTGVEAATETLRAYVDALGAEFKASPRKALFADRISSTVRTVAKAPFEAVSAPARELLFTMLEEAVESPEDRNGQRITEARLHRASLRSMLAMADEEGPMQHSAQAAVARWTEQGMFDAEDTAKMAKWQEQDTAIRLKAQKRARTVPESQD